MSVGIGRPVLRKEDARLLVGAGLYVEDIFIPGETRAYVVRSPHAHATIRGIDKRAAERASGVVAVLTGADIRADRLPPVPCVARIPLKAGTSQTFPERPVLAIDRVRFVGDPVAIIVAETLDQARDAADQLVIDYEIRPAVIGLEAATRSDAPLVHDDEGPSNVNFVWEVGDEAATNAAFARADRIVSIELVNNRVSPSPLETRGAIGQYDPMNGYTLHLSCQGAHWIKDTLCKYVLTDVPSEKVRVITPDVGGGFGTKLFLTPEYVMVLWAAKRVGRPVKWISDRTEGFLSDTHGRDNLTKAELALNAEGKFLGLRVSTLANMGAYLSEYAPTIPTGDRMHEGAYDIGAAHVQVRGVFTNTGPVESYRGAGRPEATYMIERLVDRAGRETGLGQTEIRRRNFVPASAMPYQTRLGHVFDSGDFLRNFEDAQADIDWNGFPARRAASQSRGRLRGLGISYYIGFCGGEPGVQAELQFEADGTVTMTMGTQTSGQGHATAYSQIVAERLGIPFEAVNVRQGDTAWMRDGSVTAGSRSIPLGGVAAQKAADAAITAGKSVAAEMLEAREEDIAFADGVYRVIDTNRTVNIREVAAVLRQTSDAAGSPRVLSGHGEFVSTVGTFTNGCHICEVEVDPDTGATEIIDYVAVDDFGVVINPMLVAGQVSGGVTQGIGQALLEGVVYDADGQIVTRSFMDYALPRAAHLPEIRSRTNIIPCRTNPLGTKGVGEAGAIAAPASVINALLDALAGYGVTHIDMPATPVAVWRAIHQPSAASRL